jgi:hypothetical protein
MKLKLIIGQYKLKDGSIGNRFQKKDPNDAREIGNKKLHVMKERFGK